MIPPTFLRSTPFIAVNLLNMTKVRKILIVAVTFSNTARHMLTKINLAVKKFF
jgi:hypothetical protein